MQSRRDQVQAQSFVHSRLVNAMVVADPDVADSPYRPLITGAASSLIVAALVMVAFAIYGFLRPGGATAWKQPHMLIVEKETGSRYLYLDGRLHPVLNYTSARLLLGGAPQVVNASQKSLAIAAHGQPLGIVGAPDALPAAGIAGQQTWTVCAPTMADNTGRTVTATTLMVSPGTTATGTPLAPDEAALVVADGQESLLWRGHRLHLTQLWMLKLFAGDRPPVAVRANWLQTVPAGPDVAPPEPDDFGAPGVAIDGQTHRVGELFTVQGTDGKPRYYQMTTSGLGPLSDFQYTLATADPAIAGLYGSSGVRAATLSLGALARIPSAPVEAATAGLPAEMPQIKTDLPSGTAWCLRQSMSGAPAVIVNDLPPLSDLVSGGGGLQTTDRTADIIDVGPGLGGLYALGRFTQGPGNELFLITDSGVRYPVPDGKTANVLGYGGGARPAPPELLDLLPTGPSLGAGSA